MKFLKYICLIIAFNSILSCDNLKKKEFEVTQFNVDFKEQDAINVNTGLIKMISIAKGEGSEPQIIKNPKFINLNLELKNQTNQKIEEIEVTFELVVNFENSTKYLTFKDNLFLLDKYLSENQTRLREYGFIINENENYEDGIFINKPTNVELNIYIKATNSVGYVFGYENSGSENPNGELIYSKSITDKWIWGKD